MTLQEYVALPHRFRWGGMSGDDCTTFCATWVAEQVGIDPAADLRGTYRDADGAHRILADAGGIVSFIDAPLTSLGYERTDAPEDGDIGVVNAPVGIGEGAELIGAIRFGKLWLVLAPSGIACKKLDHVAAWRAPIGGVE